MDINEKISEILKKHVEGKEFFDALDYMVRSDADVLKIYLDFVTSQFESHNWKRSVGIILTGKFGRALYNNYSEKLYLLTDDIVLVDGDLRKPNTEVETYKNFFRYAYYIVLDDSIYSGNTVNNIKRGILKTREDVVIPLVYVIYDGSKDIKNLQIKSLFKYHK